MTGLAWGFGAAALLALLVATVAAFGARRRAQQLELLLAGSEGKLERVQRQFERFVPADVVERLTGERGEYVPQRRQVTMLFADLRNFTALCDRLDPAQTVTMLNDYFQHMSRAITRHHGHINALAGDGLLALFGALEPDPWQGRDAVLAALHMRSELVTYNAELRARGLPELHFGIGIHSGEVVAGVMGSGDLNKFTVTGDPINVASRVEGLTREHQVDILITEAVRQALDQGFRLRPMPASYVKGKAEPVQTYFVEGIASSIAAADAPESGSSDGNRSAVEGP